MIRNIEGDVIIYLLTNLTRIHESLKFADQKAGVLIAANSAMLAFIYNLEINKTELPMLIVIFIGSLGLIIGAACAFLTITPRGIKEMRTRSPGIVDSILIDKHIDEDAFFETISKSDSNSIIEELQRMNYDFSKIDSKKYFWLRYAIRVSAIAWLIILLVIATKKLLNI